MKITDEAVPNALRNALTAALPHLQAGYKVKQLEWVDTGQRGFLETSYFAVSGSLQHTCSPWEKDDGPFPEHYAISFREYEPRPWVLRYWVGNNGNGLSGLLVDSFTTPEEAKAAAQADFERRVRECIVGGLDVAEVRRQALEEAATLIDEGFGKVVSKSWRNDGKPSKNDICPHDKFMYEDCEQCASTAIRALAAVKEYLTTRAEAAAPTREEGQ